jgi:hypothetical protein
MIIIKFTRTNKYYLIEYFENDFIHTSIDENFALISKIPKIDCNDTDHFHTLVLNNKPVK